MNVLEVSGLTLALGGAPTLSAVDLTLDAGEMVALIGPNGAGKSTLLKACAGLLSPGQGMVALDGQPLPALAPAERARLLGYLPQQPRIEWPLPVRDVVALGARARPVAARTTAIDAALLAFGLAPLAERPATRLSGGEQMRVHLARLAAGGHRLLLVDEPTAALDPRQQLEVLGSLRALAGAGAAVLLVLHDLALAARYCDRVVVLAEGRCLASGPPEVLLDDALLSSVFGVRGIRGEVDGQSLLLGVRPA